MEVHNEIPGDIHDAILKAFEGDEDSSSRVLVFLSYHIGEGTAAPFLTTLQRVLLNPNLFAQVAKRIVEDTKTENNDKKYRKMMSEVWEGFLKDPVPKDLGGGQKWELALKSEGTQSVAKFCFIRALARLSVPKIQALSEIARTVSRPIALNGGRALSITHVSKPIVQVVIVAAYLAKDVIENIKRWWKGEISGKRCVKNILDCGVSVAAGVTGGIGGEMIGALAGSFLGPIGTTVGAIVGSVAGGALASISAELLCRRLTQWVFGIPKSEALENAYTFLGVSAKATNSDVNSQYRRLALKYHPDKGGDAEKWAMLQYSLQIIKVSRGEL